MSEKLTPDRALYWRKKGKTLTWIAEKYHVTPQFVSIQLQKAGYIPPQRVVDENFPWHIPQEFRGNHIYRRLVWFVKMQVELGVVGEKSRAQVADLIQFMRDTGTVVDFNPEYEPFKVFTDKPGFKMVPRDERDFEAGNYIVKIRPGTKIQGLGKQLWRMPST